MNWTTSSIAQVADYWRSGLSSGQIASLMGVSKNAIVGLVNRNRDKFAPRSNGRPKRDTRPDVMPSPPVRMIERAHEAEKKPANWNTALFTRKSREGMSLKQKRKACDRDAEEDAKLITDDVKNEYDQSRMAEAVELVDLGSGQCHWPVNSGGPFLFCAAEAKEGKPYCKHHHIRTHYRAPREN